ncbi:MAG: glycerol-3-phosphate 1-O-acyltransferase PlsY [Bordetella sp.]|uniref:glycerol-3-phosphate 1-O-acyltransferase PlsY n=1 Tax=Bordetella sp. TaxID=28081 RepID=UPI003F7BF344
MAFDASSPYFAAALVVLAYLIGSIPFAVVVSRLMGLQDPRSYGSKNPGATNVLRSGSKPAAALTLLGDAAKGWFALWLARYMAPDLSWPVYAAAALAVFLGHLYPVTLGFKGGKGVATALGVLLAIQPLLALLVALTWLLMAIVFRYSSLAALVAAVCAPLYYLLGATLGWTVHPQVTTALVILAALLIYRHKANIQRLVSGAESKIGSKKKA